MKFIHLSPVRSCCWQLAAIGGMVVLTTGCSEQAEVDTSESNDKQESREHSEHPHEHGEHSHEHGDDRDGDEDG